MVLIISVLLITLVMGQSVRPGRIRVSQHSPNGNVSSGLFSEGIHGENVTSDEFFVTESKQNASSDDFLTKSIPTTDVTPSYNTSSPAKHLTSAPSTIPSGHQNITPDLLSTLSRHQNVTSDLLTPSGHLNTTFDLSPTPRGHQDATLDPSFTSPSHQTSDLLPASSHHQDAATYPSSLPSGHQNITPDSAIYSEKVTSGGLTTNSSLPNAVSEALNVNGRLPVGWEAVCHDGQSFVDWNPELTSFNWSQPITQIHCQVMHEELFLTDFREWSTQSEQPVALSIECAHEGNGSLRFPWPMKAANLVFLKIVGCHIKDYYKEYLTDAESKITQNLRVAIMENVKNYMLASEFAQMASNASMISADEHCFSLLLEKYVKRNVTMVPIFDTSVQVFFKASRDWKRQQELIPHRCHYTYLQYMDESGDKHLGAKHFFQHFKRSFPELRFYNLSNMGWELIPEELNDWRFQYPKLQYLDLSMNAITSFEFVDNGDQADGMGIIDLRYNNISQLTDKQMESFQKYRTLTIDLRGNPISCDCGSNEFLFRTLRDRPAFVTPELNQYEYLGNLTCDSPPGLWGTRFEDVPEGEIFCVEEGDGTFIVLLSSLSLIVVLIFVGGFLSYRYRKELTVLLYTRLGMVFGRRFWESKTYDAFISYSSKDDEWVINTLVKRLEHNEKGPSFKLCVHHRDFEVGAAISENVVKSVESSRHTVLVLSKNFTQSEWCIYEFRTAMHQSLIERSKHMIVIVLENVPKVDLDPDLRKCMETFTYIAVGDRLFWDKLIYSLSCGLRQKKSDSKQAKQRTNSEKYKESNASTVSKGNMFTKFLRKKHRTDTSQEQGHENLSYCETPKLCTQKIPNESKTQSEV